MCAITLTEHLLLVFENEVLIMILGS